MEPQSEESSSNSTDVEDKRKQYKFTMNEDIIMLKEIIAVQPFEKRTASKKWREIHANLKIAVRDGGALKRHFDLIYKHFLNDNKKSLKGSGLEEDYNEKMKLLEEVKSLIENTHVNLQDSSKADKVVEENLMEGKAVRQAAMETMKRTVKSPQEDTKPKLKRPRQDEMMDLLIKNEELEQMQKEKNLELDKRRLDVQDKELELRAKEFEHKKLMDVRKMDLEDKRIQLDEERNKAEKEEKKLLFQLLAAKSQ